MKKLIKSRRGIAIELAIGVMFLMMAFTIMLLSTAGLQNKHRNDDYDDFNEMIEINNVGEYVVSLVKGNYFDENNTDTASIPVVENRIEYNYTAVKDGNEYKIYRGEGLTEFTDLVPVLTITLSSDGKTITSWK